MPARTLVRDNHYLKYHPSIAQAAARMEQSNQLRAVNDPVNRDTVSTLATVYGCCGLFDLCGDRDLMSLSYAGVDPLMDWLGWMGTNNCIVERNFIGYVQPASGTRQTWVSNPCDPPNDEPVFNTCTFRVEGFGDLRTKSPTQDVTQNAVKLCDAQPRYRLDGTEIRDDREFFARLAMELLLDGFRELIITGNKTTAGQFDGLGSLIKTNYHDFKGNRCALMDSIVIDWKYNDFDGNGGTGTPTWSDGRASSPHLLTGHNLIDVIIAVKQRVFQRIGWSPQLKSQMGGRGGNVDMIILTSTQTVDCILDAYTCWRVCPGVQFAEVNLSSMEARDFRTRHETGGMFGNGFITIHGMDIPLLAYDWGLTDGSTTSDIYILVGGVGSIKTLFGEYNNMIPVPSSFNGQTKFWTTDGGRFLNWEEAVETCSSQRIAFQPRLLNWAPWLQTRIQNVVCNRAGGFLSPDPLNASFSMNQSFEPASCP